MHIEIKRANASHESDVRRCAEEAYEQYVDAIGKKPAPMVADFRKLIASGFVHVAIDTDARVLGFIVFFQVDDYFMLENVAVRTQAIGKGIGKKLIAHCEGQAKRSNVNLVKLYTNEKMTANLSIYPHLGYRETDRRHEDGFDRVYFEKRL